MLIELEMKQVKEKEVTDLLLILGKTEADPFEYSFVPAKADDQLARILLISDR